MNENVTVSPDDNGILSSSMYVNEVYRSPMLTGLELYNISCRQSLEQVPVLLPRADNMDSRSSRQDALAGQRNDQAGHEKA